MGSPDLKEVNLDMVNLDMVNLDMVNLDMMEDGDSQHLDMMHRDGDSQVWNSKVCHHHHNIDVASLNILVYAPAPPVWRQRLSRQMRTSRQLGGATKLRTSR